MPMNTLPTFGEELECKYCWLKLYWLKLCWLKCKETGSASQHLAHIWRRAWTRSTDLETLFVSVVQPLLYADCHLPPVHGRHWKYWKPTKRGAWKKLLHIDSKIYKCHTQYGVKLCPKLCMHKANDKNYAWIVHYGIYESWLFFSEIGMYKCIDYKVYWLWSFTMWVLHHIGRCTLGRVVGT